MSRSRHTSRAVALVAALVIGSSSGCVLFGTRLYESEWEPEDAAFAVEVTVPFSRGTELAARPRPVPDDTPLSELYHASVLPERERSAAGTPR